MTERGGLTDLECSAKSIGASALGELNIHIVFDICELAAVPTPNIVNLYNPQRVLRVPTVTSPQRKMNDLSVGTHMSPDLSSQVITCPLASWSNLTGMPRLDGMALRAPLTPVSLCYASDHTIYLLVVSSVSVECPCCPLDCSWSVIGTDLNVSSQATTHCDGACTSAAHHHTHPNSSSCLFTGNLCSASHQVNIVGHWTGLTVRDSGLPINVNLL